MKSKNLKKIFLVGSDYVFPRPANKEIKAYAEANGMEIVGEEYKPLGQQQQLAIARALVAQPKLLVLDEPTEGLQPSIIMEIEDAIAQLHSVNGMTILLVEQYVEFALRLANEYVVLDAGEVASAGATSDLSDDRVKELLAI